LLGSDRNPVYEPIFIDAATDSSYNVSGYALEALSEIDSVRALEFAKKFAIQASKGKLETAIAGVLIQAGEENRIDPVTDRFENMGVSNQAFQFLSPYARLLEKVRDPQKFKRAVDLIVKFRDSIPAYVRNETDPYINNTILKKLADHKKADGLNDLASYVLSKLPEKGF
jgi:hypothetical protein